MSEYNHNNYALNPLPVDSHSASAQTIAHSLGTAPAPLASPAQGEKFCRFCGNSVFAEAVMCVSCGRQIKVLQTAPLPTVPLVSENKPWSGGEVILLILLTLGVPLIGLIFGIKGLCERGKQQQGLLLLVVAIMVLYYWFSRAFSLH